MLEQICLIQNFVLCLKRHDKTQFFRGLSQKTFAAASCKLSFWQHFNFFNFFTKMRKLQIEQMEVVNGGVWGNQAVYCGMAVAATVFVGPWWGLAAIAVCLSGDRR